MVHHQGKLIAKRSEKRPRANRASSVPEVARHFGVSERSVHTWLASGCPRPARGGAYDLTAIAAWRAANVRPRPEDRKSETAKTLDDWRIRTERARALAAEDDLRIRKGELVETDWVVRLLTRHVATHNALFEQLVDRVLSVLPAELQQQDRRRVSDSVAKIVHDLRQQMAESIEEWEQELNERSDQSQSDEAEDAAD